MDNGWPQQPESDLRVDTAWRENYSGASMNQKLQGVLNAGIYSGFKVTPKSGLTVEISGLGDPNIAIVEVDSYSLTARMPVTVKKQLVAIAGKKQHVVLDVVYAKQQETTVNLRINDADTLSDHHVVVATLDIPAGATTVTSDMIVQAAAAKPVTQSEYAELAAFVVDNSLRQIKMDERLRHLEKLNNV